MIDGVASIFSVFYGMARSGMHTEDIGTNLFDGGSPFYSVYETADGKYVTLAPIEPHFYAQLLEQLGIAGDDLPAQYDQSRWPEMKERIARGGAHEDARRVGGAARRDRRVLRARVPLRRGARAPAQRRRATSSSPRPTAVARWRRRPASAARWPNRATRTRTRASTPTRCSASSGSSDRRGGETCGRAGAIGADPHNVYTWPRSDEERSGGFSPVPLIDRPSSGDLVAIHVRSLIFNGELRQGDRVHQDDIARQLGVSRIPVREAIIALDREGWLTITPHRGAFVHGLDEDSLRDHYELLGLVYGLAARRAVSRTTPDGAGATACRGAGTRRGRARRTRCTTPTTCSCARCSRWRARRGSAA